MLGSEDDLRCSELPGRDILGVHSLWSAISFCQSEIDQLHTAIAHNHHVGGGQILYLGVSSFSILLYALRSEYHASIQVQGRSTR